MKINLSGAGRGIYCFGNRVVDSNRVEIRKKTTEEELKKLETEISQIEGNIETTQKEKKTLQNQIYILKNKIDKLGLQIQQSNVMIHDIGFQISDTQSSIEKTSLKIENSRQQLSNILRTIYEKDQLSLIEILLSEAQLSDFFDDLIQLETLNAKNQELLEEIKNLKSYLEEGKFVRITLLKNRINGKVFHEQSLSF
jgi:septal ring factor EnvC (AmiA/AmiB activator)